MASRLYKAAEKIVASLEKNIGEYSDEKPFVVENEDGVSVVWEAGPFDWTMNDGYGLFEELKSLGMGGEYKERKLYSVPKGYHTEPYNGYSLALYKE